MIKRLAENDIKATYTDNVTEFISKEGFDPVYGARPLRRAIQSKVEDALAEEMLDNNIQLGDSIKIDCVRGKIKIVKE